MVIAYQGFAIKKNLDESELDRSIINNLGESPIADDISLFFNNKRNTSTMVVSNSNVSGNNLIFPNAQIVFSNYTPVSVNNTTYYVKNSNGIDTFQLSTKEDLSDTVSLPPVGTYIRNDEVTKVNITNLSRLRRSTDVNKAEEDTRLSYLNTNNNILLDGGSTALEILSKTELNLDVYRFKNQKAVMKTRNFIGKKILKTDGLYLIKDPDNRNVQAGALSDSAYPGLFIRDPLTGNNVRAFSTNEQPWTPMPSKEAPVYLETPSTAITIGNLYFNNSTQSLGIDLSIKNNANFLTTLSTPLTTSSFTHKIAMKINGETFYLCLKKE